METQTQVYKKQTRIKQGQIKKSNCSPWVS